MAERLGYMHMTLGHDGEWIPAWSEELPQGDVRGIREIVETDGEETDRIQRGNRLLPEGVRLADLSLLQIAWLRDQGDRTERIVARIKARREEQQR